jgi:hypothetical protein
MDILATGRAGGTENMVIKVIALLRVVSFGVPLFPSTQHCEISWLEYFEETGR